MTASGVKKKKRQSPAWVSGTQGWKAVDVAGDILLGAEEGGFAGLEVLDDINLLTDLDLAGKAARTPPSRPTRSRQRPAVLSSLAAWAHSVREHSYVQAVR